MRRIPRTEVAPWVVELTEDVIGPSPVEIGKRYIHPEDGLIEITSGQYWGLHGLSNHWHWNVLDPETKQAVRGGHGYGGQWPEADE